MKWRDLRRSTNVEDRRGGRGRVTAGAGLGGGAILAAILFAMLSGEDPARVVEMLDQVQAQAPVGRGGGRGAGGVPPGDEQAEFVSAVLADTEDAWGQIFAAAGDRYQPPTLVLFADAVDSACGTASSAVGPFYCPGDRQVYLDLTFFDDLHRRFGAPGDFARAYVIAHEIGHHVQTLLGISDEIRRMESGMNAESRNALSVLQELQADCFAGVWGHHAGRKNILERGDVEEGLGAATAIGDDTLQRRGGGRVQPESFTHGSSEQRVRWFTRGLEEGQVSACDTYSAGRP